MPPSVDEPLVSGSRADVGLLLIGYVIASVATVALAWNGGRGGDVVHEILTLPTSDLAKPGQRLLQIGWCHLGVALAGTLVSMGLRRSAWRNGLSQACVLLIGLHALLALFGTFAVCLGSFNLWTGLHDLFMSDSAITSQLMLQTTAQPVAMVSLGWRMLTIAQAVMLVGIVLQFYTRPKYVTRSTQWPLTTLAALILMGLLGVFVAALWIQCGLTLQNFATSGGAKASDIVRQLWVVLFCNGVGSCVLLGYALLISGLAVNAVVTAQSAVASIEKSSSDPSSSLIR